MREPFIIELSEAQLLPENRVEADELGRFFPKKNPFWTSEGEPFEIFYREYALKHLSTKLPQGYVVDLSNESIDIINPGGYLQETINRLQNTNPQQPIDYPLGWWKKEVCLFCDILIYFDEELFTLREFLLYMISLSKDDGIKKLYVGGVFEYYD